MNLRVLSDFLARRFSIVLLFAFVLGLICPGLERAPTAILTIVLALQIFFACFKIAPEDMRACPLKRALSFYLLRFLILPAAAYPLIAYLSPSYTLAVFLLLLLPAGTASPAYATIFRGNVALSLLLVVVSSIAAPFVIPAAFQLFAGREMHIDTFAMFRTLMFMIFCPLLLHLPLRRYATLSSFITAHNALFLVPFSATTLSLSLALRRDMIFAAPMSSGALVLASLGIYLALFLVVWGLLPLLAAPLRTSFALASALNNVTLGLVLALVHLDRHASLFMVAASVAWALLLLPIQLLSRANSIRD